LFAASPDTGYATAANPLRVGLTWNITGGKAPYYYAMDWNNDGQFDYYINAVYLRTVSVFHDYYPIGVTPYQAMLRVTDSENTILTSTPVTITLLATQSLSIDPVASYADNDTNPANTPPLSDYQFPSGSPVYFRAAVMNGAEPYSYQWDFNEDGSVDSTLPQATYTYTYTQPGTTTFLARLTVIDGNDEQATFDYIVTVKGLDTEIPPVPAFEIVLCSDPPAVGVDEASGFQLIDIQFRAGSSDPLVPSEPRLDLSVVVNPDPQKAGVPPYEYYWDFENDGAYDSQFPSPTIPYYDDARRILVNPYALLGSEIQKSFVLRCLVIDGSGKRQEEYRAIVVRRLTTEPGEFAAVPGYGVVSGPYAGLPYSEVDDNDPVTPGMQYPDITVDFGASNISGSSGQYQWQLDVDGNGLPEWPLVDDDGNPATPSVPGWDDVSGTSVHQVVHFGPYDDDFNAATPPVTDWPAVGYYPCKLLLRARELQGTPPAWVVVDDLTYEMPVSLAARPAIDEMSGTLKARAGHNVAASWDNTTRTLIVIGGAQGTTPLRDVESMTQTVDPDPSIPDPLVAQAHTWLNFERHDAVLFGDTDAPTAFVCGGFNLINNILASMEDLGFTDILNNTPWNLYGEQAIELGYYPLEQVSAQAAYISEPLWWVSSAFNAGYVFVGGLHPPSGSDSDQVSGRILSFDPGRPPLMPAFVAMDGGNRGMITERYDGALVYIAAQHRLYVIGGRVASGQSVSTVEAFNFQSAEWELAPSMLNARSGHVAFAIDDGNREVIYVLGGAYYPPGGAQRTALTTAEVFDPETGTWSYTLPLNLATENGAAATLPSKDTLSFGSKTAVWYFGGADTTGAETNILQELVYGL
jgi:PKD repeat protein